MPSASPPLKPLVWIASAKKDLLALPADVVDIFGYALHLAQTGKKHDQAKPLTGFGSAGVLEVVEDWRGNTYPPYTRLDWQRRSSSSTYFKRSPSAASPHRSRTWT